MRRTKTIIGWGLLVPIGGMLMGFGIMLASPGAVLCAIGLLLWTCADRLLKQHPGLTASNADWDDEEWRSYLSHPSAQGMGQRKVHGEDR